MSYLLLGIILVIALSPIIGFIPYFNKSFISKIYNNSRLFKIYIILIPFTVMSFTVIYFFNKKPPNKSGFGLKVIEISDNFYNIKFTNNNWRTEDFIIDTVHYFSFNSPIKSYIVFKCIYSTKKQTIKLAKTFDTYEKCIEYNNKIYKTLDSLNKLNTNIRDSIARSKIIKIY